MINKKMAIAKLRREVQELESKLNATSLNLQQQEMAISKKVQLFREDLVSTHNQEIENLCASYTAKINVKREEIHSKVNSRASNTLTTDCPEPLSIPGYTPVPTMRIRNSKEVSAVQQYIATECPKDSKSLLQKLNEFVDTKNTESPVCVTFSLFMTIAATLCLPILCGISLLYGFSRFIHTYKHRQILDKYASVKEYLSSDTQSKDLNIAHTIVDEYIDRLIAETCSAIRAKPFNIDEETIHEQEMALLDDLDRKKDNLQEQLGVLEAKKQEIHRLEQELQSMQLSQQSETEKEVAKSFSIDWQLSLPSKIVLGMSEKSTLMSIPLKAQNYLIISEKSADLYQLAKICISQLLCKVHPHLLTQHIMDAKNKALPLKPFLNLKDDEGIQFSYVTFSDIEETVANRLTQINEEIDNRSNNILNSYSSIEDFNAVMETEKAVGACYHISHIFGLNGVSKDLYSLLRIGPSTGCFSFVYLTIPELLEIATPEFVAYFNSILQFSSDPLNGYFPLPRTPKVICDMLIK